MTIEETLRERSESKCELCSSSDGLVVFEVAPAPNPSSDSNILLCGKCNDQVQNPANLDAKHWFCLNDSMWSQVPVVQVMAFRILTWLKAEAWAQDLLDQLYLDDETKSWAEAGIGDFGGADGNRWHQRKTVMGLNYQPVIPLH